MLIRGVKLIPEICTCRDSDDNSIVKFFSGKLESILQNAIYFIFLQIFNKRTEVFGRQTLNLEL